MTAPEVGVGPDPDPTPTATPWQEYLAAAQSLDAVVRECSTNAATSANAATAAPAMAELARARERLDQQRARLVGEAARAGLPPPWLVPTPAEQAAVQARVAAGPAAPALHECHRLLDLADAHLTPPPVSPGYAPAVASGRQWWPPPVWLLVAVPLGAATLAVCALILLLSVLR